MSGKSYVYLIVVDGVVRYVGKGSGNRLHQHLRRVTRINQRRKDGSKVRTTRFYNRLAKAVRNDCTVEAKVLVDNLTHDEALKIEAIEIARRENLWNEWPGGFGHGYMTPAIIKNLSKKITATWTDEKISELRMLGIQAAQTPEKIARDISVLAKIRANGKVQERRVANLRVVLATPENKERAAEHATKLWSDPATRTRMVESLTAAANRPENKERLSAEMKAKHKTLMAGYKTYLATPEGKAKRQQQMRDVWSSGQRKRAAPKPPADRSGKLKKSWAARNEKRDTMVLTLCQRPEGATPRELYAVIGRRHTALLTSFVERGLIKRIGGYHNGRYHANE